MKTSTYFNTTGESGNRLRDKINMCKSQNQKVLAIVADKKETSAWQIYNILNTHLSGHYMLITSIRRSLNNLANEGKIIKTENKVLAIRTATNTHTNLILSINQFYLLTDRGS